MGLVGCCGKAILITVNTLFLLFGLLFLGCGIALKVGFKYIEALLEEFIKNIKDSNNSGAPTTTPAIDLGPLVNNVAIAFIVIGIVIFVISILGMCGACCDNKCMLATYAAIILLILIAQVALVVVIAIGTFNGRIKDEVKTIITEDFVGINDYTTKSILINIVQFSLQCCGVDSSKDYDGAKKWEKTYSDSNGQVTLKIPVTCCKAEFPDITPTDRNCLTNPNTINSNMDTGCYEQAAKYITESYRTIVIIVLCIYFGVQLLLAIFAIYLAVMIGKKKKVPTATLR